MSRFLRVFLCMLLLHATILPGPVPALADGSVSFHEDVAPLLRDRPDLLAALGEVEFPWLGAGRRISGKVSPGLAGRRVGPYVFPALWREQRVEVRFATYTRFYDENGKLLGEDEGEGSDLDLEKATKLVEEVTAVGITPI